MHDTQTKQEAILNYIQEAIEKHEKQKIEDEDIEDIVMEMDAEGDFVKQREFLIKLKEEHDISHVFEYLITTIKNREFGKWQKALYALSLLQQEVKDIEYNFHEIIMVWEN